MTAITVTKVAGGDIDALLTSVGGLFREDSGQHDALTDQGWPARDGAAYYSSLMSSPACLLLLARDGSQVIGHLVGRISGPSSIQAECMAVLESLRVAPGSRRAGAGGMLVERFFAWARERGARQARVTAYAANDTALRFYARHGFTPMSVTSRAAL